jgi:hypothetical protein
LNLDHLRVRQFPDGRWNGLAPRLLGRVVTAGTDNEFIAFRRSIRTLTQKHGLEYSVLRDVGCQFSQCPFIKMGARIRFGFGDSLSGISRTKESGRTASSFLMTVDAFAREPIPIFHNDRVTTVDLAPTCRPTEHLQEIKENERIYNSKVGATLVSSSVLT